MSLGLSRRIMKLLALQMLSYWVVHGGGLSPVKGCESDQMHGMTWSFQDQEEHIVLCALKTGS